MEAVTFESAWLGILCSVRAAAKQIKITTKMFSGAGQRLESDEIPSRGRLDELPSRGQWADRYESETMGIFSLSGHPNPSPICSLCETPTGGIQAVWQTLFEWNLNGFRREEPAPLGVLAQVRRGMHRRVSWVQKSLCWARITQAHVESKV